MTYTCVETTKPLTLIGGGEATADDLASALALAPTCVAADSGAHLALEAGVDLAAVIGDMDSISASARARIAPQRFHHIAEQDSTDFDKALRHIKAPLIIAVGFSGGRVDHGLAALNTLVCRADRHVVLLGAQDIIFLCPPAFQVPTPEGTRVSLFPMGAVQGRSEGLFWPIDGIDFAPGARTGTSNRATGPVSLEMDAPVMLCIMPRAFLQPVVQALSATRRWPAPAAPHKGPLQS
ncbi:thiamine diphosphokinase [Roseobacter denitrificans]|uniref:Thiamine diphosphokinase n=1 Tax=Roseobacter denitrificans (strain ATCC 33942 / OCh 114) TaxID=375451 RepID=Q168R8_ROSDO|nr:thiamine diphosphokinase [Roseobacter denitrificans]ABG31525.1 thiamine pyrophosphokinase, putative [Roseobacter denitrificans OCh 114]AVL54524.1 thiamine diphosphokinase [Roseobacter denitrificans]SFF90367.1 thiamine diphosphokinase [Roseobacter denitrificans OCh 114]